MRATFKVFSEKRDRLKLIDFERKFAEKMVENYYFWATYAIFFHYFKFIWVQIWVKIDKNYNFGVQGKNNEYYIFYIHYFCLVLLNYFVKNIHKFSLWVDFSKAAR
jgi:hypothetical protein